MNLWQFYKDNPSLLEAKIGNDLAAIAAIVAGTSTKNALNVFVDGGSLTTTPSGMQAVTEANVDLNFGTWGYASGVSGTPTIGAEKRVLGISAHSTLGGSFTINGGSTITVPANVSVNIAPLGNLVNPTIVFTGTDTFFVEFVS